MPEDLVAQVAGTKDIVADHYVGRLQRRIELQGDAGSMTAVLSGHRREIGAVGREKERRGRKAEGFSIEKPDDAVLGYTVAAFLKKDSGDEIVVNNQRFKVVHVLAATGSELEDASVYINLRRMQQMYNLRGRITAIEAIGCVCPVLGKITPMKFIKDTLEKQVATVTAAQGLPTPEVIILLRAFEMRDKSRRMLDSVGTALSLALLVLCGLGMGVYIFTNARERRYEMAVLSALGYAPWATAGVLVGKLMVVSVVGGLLGFVAGTGVAAVVGPPLIVVAKVSPALELWWHACILSLGIWFLAAWGGVWGAFRVDPAELLRNQ